MGKENSINLHIKGENRMDQRKHLPIIGVGPIIVIPQLVLTVAGLILSRFSAIPCIKLGIFRLCGNIAGVLLVFWGVYLWIAANFKEKINDGIKNNHLITKGVYSMTRNPIYSAFFLICFGVIFIANNLLLFFVPIICWSYMTVLLKITEEKWLLNLYGDEYRTYCKKVNRIIPWIKHGESPDLQV